MERYRRQEEPSDYAHEAKPKKKIRGCVGSSLRVRRVTQVHTLVDMGPPFSLASVSGLGDASELVERLLICRLSTFMPL